MVEPGTLEELEQAFDALSNVNRLQLLLKLQTPQAYNDIDLSPSRPTSSADAQRTISRQAVQRHIQKLADARLVHDDGQDGLPRRFVLDQARLFSLIEDARQLFQPRQERATHPSSQPHLTLVRGLGTPRFFPLDEHPCLIGSSPQATIRLDHDERVQDEHARIQRSEAYHVTDLTDQEDATAVNWHPMPQDGETLRPGDVLRVGRSLLVFQAGTQEGP